jgi:PBP1b-binding outer membrane lipoprotein LpoB
MKTYTLLLAMVSVLFLTNCKSSAGDADSQNQQTEEETTQAVEQEEVLKDAAVWAAEMLLEGSETKKGTVTFFEDDKIKVKNGVSDKTYTYQYIDSGAAVKLTNVDKTDEVLYFMLTDATDTKEVWESVDAPAQAVWTLTKE